MNGWFSCWLNVDVKIVVNVVIVVLTGVVTVASIGNSDSRRFLFIKTGGPWKNWDCLLVAKSPYVIV